MSQPNPSDAPILTLTGDAGSTYSCRLLHVLDFEGERFALLVKLSEDPNHGKLVEECLVIMKLIQQGSDFTFRHIDNDAQFKRVLDFVEQTARAVINEDV